MENKKMVVIRSSGYLIEDYINAETICGKLINTRTEYLNPDDEHDHGTEIYTVLGDDGKTYKGAHISTYLSNYIIMSKREYLEKLNNYVKRLLIEKKNLLKQAKDVDKEITKVKKLHNSLQEKTLKRSKKKNRI